MGFSRAQSQAITHGDGPCLVLAGPGSGKTLTIVNRVKCLIEKYKVRPEEILVITFTKYAAAEMKLRLKALSEGRNLPVVAGTFHGIYYGILKWAYRFGPQNIFSEEEKYRLLNQIVSHQEQLEIEDGEDFIRQVAGEIGVVKNNGAKLGEYQAKCCAPDIFRKIYEEYETGRKQLKKIDFDDMLVLCHELFIKRPDMLAAWQKKFRYILIDEFQDINQVQYDVIKMLAAPEDNLFAVGDDDQAIYGFRGADSRLMFRFKEEFPQAREILLDVNYRSRANIVRNALKVIGHNKVRFTKKIRAKKEDGVTVHVQETTDSAQEAEYVAKEIASRIGEGMEPENIAVLYRVHTDARAVAEKLVDGRIPFQMREHMPNVYRHFIAKDFCTYLRMAAGGRSRSDFLQIMNRPKRYLSRDCVSAGEKVDFEELRKFYFDKGWMMDRVDQMEWDLKMLAKMAPYAAIQYLRKRVGYDDFLREYAKERQVDADALFEVVTELEDAAKPFFTAEEWFSHIEEYTETLEQKARQGGRQEQAGGVYLLTLHAAKGLEFDTVFLIQANEGRVPYQKALDENGEEEERRLFYVGMTRAKEVLKISYVKLKNGKKVEPSRFVGELLEEEGID